MTRTFYLMSGAFAATLVVLAARTATAGGQSGALLRLQTGTPGTVQTGHANVSGTVKAGQFQGDGAALTGVNANLLDGIDSSAFLQAVPNPLIINGGEPSVPVIKGTTSSSAVFSCGVFGSATASVGLACGVQGESSGTSGTGVYGLASSSSGPNYGVLGRSDSSSGVGVYGWAILSTGTTYGGFFESSSSSGTGVRGVASRNTGSTIGVHGKSVSGSGIGVYGESSATAGTTHGVFGRVVSTEGTGVKGLVVPTDSTGVGVWGLCTAPNGWGVYADGRMGSSGTKSFRIDHPLDPQNKWLLHYCAEGPEPLNIYSGIVTTDEKGFAVVQLPSYFDEINRDPRVQLTVNDRSEDFVMAKVVGEIKNGSCRLRTSKPLVTVYWEVKAIRNDRWVQKNGAPVEPDKTGSERGKYQHPELYGLPVEMGSHYEPEAGPRK